MYVGEGMFKRKKKKILDEIKCTQIKKCYEKKYYFDRFEKMMDGWMDGWVNKAKVYTKKLVSTHVAT